MTALATALAALVPYAPAAGPAVDELDLSIVPARTPFLVHVDVEGLLGCTLAETLLSMEEVRDDMDLDQIRRELGIDPLEDVLSVTAFSSGPQFAEAGAVVVRTTDALEGAIERFRAEGELREGRLGDLTVYGLEDGMAYVHRAGDERLVVISDDEDELARAIDVVRGDAPSIATSGSASLRPEPKPGAFVLVEVGEAMTALLEDHGEPASRLGKLARRFSLQVGERGGDTLFVDAELEASDLQGAQDVANILNGLKSLVSLAAGHEDVPQLALDVLNDIRIEAAGTLVRLSIEMDSHALADELSALEDD